MPQKEEANEDSPLLEETNSFDTQSRTADELEGRKLDFNTISLKQDKEGFRICAVTTVGLLFFFYFFTGLIYYTTLQHWSFTDAVYFTVNTFLSIGYGDMPITEGHERIFTAFFVLFGVGFIGSAVGVVVSGELETKENDMAKYMKSEKYILEGGEANFSIHKWEFGYYRRKLLWHIIQILFIITLGSITMGYGENWTPAQAFYWACVTITTTGYGDLTPTTKVLKLFCTVYSLYGVIMMTQAMSFLAQFPVLWNRIHEKEKFLYDYKHLKTYKEVESSIFSSDYGLVELGLQRSPKIIEKAEFVLMMLLQLEKVPFEEIKECARTFDVLDSDGSGTITVEDFTADAIRNRCSSSVADVEAQI